VFFTGGGGAPTSCQSVTGGGGGGSKMATAIGGVSEQKIQDFQPSLRRLSPERQ